MWQESELVFANEQAVLYLGTGSPPSSPRSRRSSGKTAPAVLVRANRVFERQPQDAVDWQKPSDPLLYFELYIKTSGGGLQPSGSIGIGLAEPCTDTCELDFPVPGRPPTLFVHYHDSSRRFESFPRRAGRAAGRQYALPFGTGDTVGCGWLPNGDVFFTLNGRHMGVAFTEVWGTLCPAVDFDSPGACLELSMGRGGIERPLRYLGDGLPPRGAERWVHRMRTTKIAARGLLDAALHS